MLNISHWWANPRTMPFTHIIKVITSNKEKSTGHSRSANGHGGIVLPPKLFTRRDNVPVEEEIPTKHTPRLLRTWDVKGSGKMKTRKHAHTHRERDAKKQAEGAARVTSFDMNHWNDSFSNGNQLPSLTGENCNKLQKNDVYTIMSSLN